MAGIFISYRREDAAPWAGRIYERLAHEFKRDHLFMDVDNITPGSDFVRVLEEHVTACDAILVIIGKNWLSARNAQGQRRIDDPYDFVRLEIEAALKRDVRVVPILVDGAQMPAFDALPQSLRALVRRQSVEISHARFGTDVKRLTEALDSVMQPESRRSRSGTQLTKDGRSEYQSGRRNDLAATPPKPAVRAAVATPITTPVATPRAEPTLSRKGRHWLGLASLALLIGVAVGVGIFSFRPSPKPPGAAPEPAAAVAPAQPNRSELERAAAFIKETEDQARLEAFIRQFSDSPYAAMARARLQELKSKAIAVSPSSLPQLAPTTECDRLTASTFDSRSVAPGVELDRIDHVRSVQACEDAVAKYPGVARLSFQLGRAYRAKKDNDRAIADYNKAIELDPKYAAAYVSRGVAYHYSKKDYDRAIADYDQAIRLDPVFTIAFANRGLAHEQAGRREQALRDFRAALALPAQGRAHLTARERLSVLEANPTKEGPTQEDQVAIAAPPGGPKQQRCDGIEVAVGASQHRCIKPGSGKTTWFRDCDTCPEMVLVPAGEFVMGSPNTEDGRLASEGPQHKVSIRAAFAVARFKVTRDEFEAFVRATSHVAGDKCWAAVDKGPTPVERAGSFRNPGFQQEGRHPVVCVNWHAAKAFAAWLSKKTGKDYRLLTEAEREYVARAGTTTPFWWGSSISTRQANYDGNYTYAGGAKGEWRQKTVPVNFFEPNPWGLYQVHGNVWGWTEDCWNASYQGAPTDGSAWTTGDCTRRIARGGSWTRTPQALRSAQRAPIIADIPPNGIGLRLARTISP